MCSLFGVSTSKGAIDGPQSTELTRHTRAPGRGGRANMGRGRGGCKVKAARTAVVASSFTQRDPPRRRRRPRRRFSLPLTSPRQNGADVTSRRPLRRNRGLRARRDRYDGLAGAATSARAPVAEFCTARALDEVLR